jgi:two-component system, NarL family, sensor histidine kinase UhpB
VTWLYDYRFYPEQVAGEQSSRYFYGAHVPVVGGFCALTFVPVVQASTGLRPVPTLAFVACHAVMVWLHVHTRAYQRHPIAWSHFAAGTNLFVAAGLVWMTAEVWSTAWLLYGLYVTILILAGAPKPSSIAMVAAVPIAVAAVWEVQGVIPLMDSLAAAFPLALVATMTYASAGMMVSQQRKVRAQAEQLRENAALEEERRRIARDLHDILGAAMTEVSLWQDVAATGARDPAALDRARRRMRDAMDELRACVRVLGGGAIEAASIEHLIRARVSGLCDAAGCTLALSVTGPPILLPLVTVTDVLKVVTEATHNAVRHGEARSVAVEVDVDAAWLRVTVTDDGSGLGAAAGSSTGAQGGTGLSALRHRAEALGGSFSAEANPEGGTAVRWTVPQAAAAA